MTALHTTIRHFRKSTSLALRHSLNSRTAHFHHNSTQRAYKLLSIWASKRSSYHFCWALKDVSRPMPVPYQSDIHQNPIFLTQIWHANNRSKAKPTCKLNSMWQWAFTPKKRGARWYAGTEVLIFGGKGLKWIHKILWFEFVGAQNLLSLVAG
jgi:hypothetical protein